MKKLNKNTGFTLVEMLIVVAIIAILVAVSIPLVSSSLENARERTDEANERAAKAEAAIIYLMGDKENGNNIKPGDAFNLQYDAAAGTLVKTATDNAYGKCTGDLDHSGKYITVDVTTDGEITVFWSNGSKENPMTHAAATT